MYPAGLMAIFKPTVRFQARKEPISQIYCGTGHNWPCFVLKPGRGGTDFQSFVKW